MRGENLFFTGCAGTGKSVRISISYETTHQQTVLKEIIRVLPKQTTFVTASTGMAAINIGGITLHSFAGIEKGIGTKLELLAKVKSRGRNMSWWKRATSRWFKLFVVTDLKP